MKATENFIEELLSENKSNLHTMASKFLHDRLFDDVRNALGMDLCDTLKNDIKEKITVFLIAEGYEK